MRRGVVRIVQVLLCLPIGVLLLVLVMRRGPRRKAVAASAAPPGFGNPGHLGQRSPAPSGRPTADMGSRPAADGAAAKDRRLSRRHAVSGPRVPGKSDTAEGQPRQGDRWAGGSDQRSEAGVLPDARSRVTSGRWEMMRAGGPGLPARFAGVVVASLALVTGGVLVVAGVGEREHGAGSAVVSGCVGGSGGAQGDQGTRCHGRGDRHRGERVSPDLRGQVVAGSRHGLQTPTPDGRRNDSPDSRSRHGPWRV